MERVSRYPYSRSLHLDTFPLMLHSPVQNMLLTPKQLCAHSVRRGFTIVELLIVIVVIGILASITIVAYSGVQQQARVVVLKNDMSTAATTLELTKVQEGTYPTSQLAADAELKPSPGTVYQYTYTAAESSYCLTGTNSGVAYMITTANPTLTAGVCPGHTAPSGGGSNPPAATVPSAPTAVSASGGNAQAAVSWTLSSSDGGSTVSSYVVTASPGSFTATAGPAATTAVVTGLSNGTSYTFTVKATNAIGSSPASTISNAVIPDAPSTPVTKTADQVWTPQQVYDWNPNWSNVTYTPPNGSFGAEAINLSGVSYRWKHYNDVWPVDVSVARPSPTQLASLETTAQSWGASASWGTGINGYFAVSGGQGIAQVFRNGYWIIVADTMSSSAGDISQIVNAVVSNFP
jgi:prepilin-type N-terminal cleavage/methylation domain-containing protein